ncbi:MAG TPA: nitroreductase family protein [Bacteroidales bacterium]|jgi:nitroreductase|nr:nitroreductase family protein [Bacteroidales bacterium]HOS71883.1 nitroreductase family protein [Bacteroidales bacterium]HQH22821.1 nitroreductase family protein [Bacteroidales bacterium]HQJ81713.1 nitroreductase family protein [Bacteroidales bacterium]
MKFEDLVFRTRSFRRFDESVRIGRDILEKLAGLARLSASAANRQPLKFILISSPDECSKVFPSLAWAGYLKDWEGPAPGERPSAYIIILGDRSIAETFGVDHGIAAQSIMLGATEAGFGGCMIASVKKELLRKNLNIPERFEILLVLALGKPVENVIIDEIKNGDVKYWRDLQNNHHVPKRPLNELIIRFVH